MLVIFALFLVPIIARAALYAVGNEPRSWRDADWSSTGLLPKASADPQARVIIFTGTAGAWKGIFAVHSWIVLKHANATAWTRYDVVGWGEPVRTNNWPADGRWFGNMPVAIVDISGADAEKLIPRIEDGHCQLSLCTRRRLPDLAWSEQQQLRCNNPAFGARTRHQSSAQCGRPRFSRMAFMPA